MVRSIAFTLISLAAIAPASADVGAMVDAGVPSGAGASIVYRPISPVRLHAGAAHNGVAPGLTGGLTLASPFGVVKPTVSVEVGRFAEGDASVMWDAAPDRFGYDYVSGHVGVEVGVWRVAWYLRAGASYLRATVGEDVTRDDGTTTTMADGEVTAVTPSIRTGFIVYLGG